REEGYRCISPVVDAPWWAVLRIELENGKKFDSRDPQILKIGDLFDQSTKSTSVFFGDPGAGMTREALYVHFVNDGLIARLAQRGVTLPVIPACIYNHALHRGCGVVASLSSRLARVRFRDRDSATIGVEQDFRGVKPHGIGRIKRSMNSITVELPRLNFRNQDVPIVISAIVGRVESDHAWMVVVFTFKKQQLNL